MVVNENIIVVKRENFIKSTMILAYSFITFQKSKKRRISIPEKKESGQVILSLAVTPSNTNELIATFITISEVKLDNKKIPGFRKKTIELSAYQEGDIKLIFQGKIEARAYKSISFILDYESDEYGDFPGCYTQSEENNKQRLGLLTEINEGISIRRKFEIKPEMATELVLKCDLRKIGLPAFEEYESSVSEFYEEEKINSFNAVLKEQCGEVRGTIRKSNFLSGDMYVLAYKKGDFRYLNETRMIGTDNIIFPKAKACSKVKPYGSFNLSLLEQGIYEIHIAIIEKHLNKVFMLKGLINPSSNISDLLLNKINVKAQSRIQLNIDILNFS